MQPYSLHVMIQYILSYLPTYAILSRFGIKNGLKWINVDSTQKWYAFHFHHKGKIFAHLK